MRTIKREIAGAFILSSDGQIVIGRNIKGGIGDDRMVVPAGGLDPGETTLDAAIRETLEEVNIDIRTAKTIHKHPAPSSGTGEKTLRETKERVIVKMKFHNFIVQMDQPASAIPVTAGDDLAEAYWIPLDKLHTVQFTDSLEEFFKILGYLK